MKRMTVVIAALMMAWGMAFSETNTDEQALENVVNSAKSNAQAYKADRDTNVIETNAAPAAVEPKKENGAAVTEKNTNNYMTIPFSFSIIPLWGFGFKTIDNFQVNIGASYCDRLQGASFGFINIVGESAKGIDCSLVSFTGIDFKGAQFSLVAFNGNDFTGAQFSLVAFAGNDFEGVQGGLVNIVGRNFKSAQAGLVNVIGGDFHYAQAGLVNLVGGNFEGFQAGLVNATGNSFRGGEAGLVNLTWKNFSGPQVGLVNYADKVNGLQVGLVNYAGEIEGVSIGLVSIVGRNGQTHGQLWIDETGFVNVALIHGSKIVYNIYTVGMDVNANLWSYGLGLGLHIPLDPFYINIEGISSSVSHIERWDGMNTINRLRVYFGFSLFEHLSFIAGASLNYYRNWNENGDNTVSVNPFYNVSRSFGNNDKLWPGVFAGVTF